MAKSSSVINVSIIGDATKLIGAVGAADVATGGLIKSALKLGIAAGVVREGFDFLGDALSEGDRLGDAVQRLNIQIGKINTRKLEDTADNFSDMGASAQDILELEAIFADLATSAGVAEIEIAANAEQLSLMALALAQVHDADPTSIITAIGQAIGGQTRGLKQYGVDLTEAEVTTRALADTGKTLASELTAQELATARTSLIMEAFAPILADVASGTGDVAQKQDELGAKFETLMGKVGAGLEGPIGGLLDWVNDMVDAIPGAIEGWQMLAAAIGDAAADILGPLARVADALRTIISLFDQGQRAFTVVPGGSRTPRGSPGSGSDRGVSNANRRENERNGLYGGLGGP